MKYFKKLIIEVVKLTPSFSGWMIKTLLIQTRLVDPNSKIFTYFLILTGLRIKVSLDLFNGMKLTGFWGEAVSDAIRKRRVYEPETVGVVQNILNEGDIFFDIGTHIGQYTLIASELVGTKGQIHSFEADNSTFDTLRKNIKLNNLKNVYANNIAISDKAGKVVLNLGASDNIGSNSIVAIPYNSTGESISVDSVSLDGYCSSLSIKKINLIKADIEGAEHLLLKGGVNIFTGKSPPVLILEINNTIVSEKDNSVSEYLLMYGYEVFRIFENHLQKFYTEGKKEEYFNVICFPKNFKKTCSPLNMFTFK